MLPTVVGVIFLVFMAFVVYWFLSTVHKPVETNADQNLSEIGNIFNFETAPEIMAYPIENIGEVDNNLKLLRVDDTWHACWSIQEGVLQEKKAEAGETDGNDELTLRIYEAGDLLRHHDVKTAKLKGCCRLYLRSYRAYYVSLGLKRGKKFYPMLVSNTIIPSDLQ